MRFLVILLCLFVTPAFAADTVKPYKLSDNDKVSLDNVQKYLSGIHTVNADFVQAAPTGDITSGKFCLERPNKLRMEYDPPTPVLMITSGNYLIYYDRELDQISRISLDSTLIGFLAKGDVKFDSSVVITNMTHENKMLRISLVQSARPKDGTLTLEFSDSPLALHNMIVEDGSGQVTTVALNNAQFNLPLPESLFVFKDPHANSRPIRN